MQTSVGILSAPTFFMLARLEGPLVGESGLVALERRIAGELGIEPPRNVMGPHYYPLTYKRERDAWRVAMGMMDQSPGLVLLVIDHAGTVSASPKRSDIEARA